ncbi:MAG: LuxR C-terminal-related transcriptional regulator, partial [Aggregatilineales bacterium]
GKTFSQIITAIMTQTIPDLEVLCPDLPVALVDLIYRMLEKDRDLRISSIRLVGAELENILLNWNTTSINVIPPRTPDNQRFTRPSMSTTDIPKHNLPVQVTAFIGREQELNELESLVADPTMRLITIVGPGGMGKTRLALEAAQRHVGRFSDGIFFVPLAPLTESENIISTIADSVGFHTQEAVKNDAGDTALEVNTVGVLDRSEWQQLLDYFADKQMLLIFDNFEHVLEGSALASELLKHAPDVQIVTTSRARLNLQEEAVFRIEGMDFPEDDVVDFDADYSAIRLFTQSARRAQPAFELTDADLPHVVEICRMVQGMPLGILLAAAWVEMLSLEEIVEEMRQNSDFLETDIRNMPERHRSLRAIFDYSWQMLADDEREAFARLSVFRGGCTRNAALKAIGASLKTLTGLVNKSLLRRDPDSGRYELHELIRQYAAERLDEKGETDAIRALHSAYYAQKMANYEADLRGQRQPEALDEIDADLDNIRNGWRRAITHNDYDAVIQYATSLDLFYVLRSRHDEPNEMFDFALNTLQFTQEPLAQITRGRILARYVRTRQDKSPENRDTFTPLLDEALAIAEAHDHQTEVIYCLQILSHMVMLHEKDYESAREVIHRRLEISRSINDLNGEADALFNLGYIAAMCNDVQGLKDYTQQSYDIYRRIGDRYSEATALHNLGAYEEMTGNLDAAEAFFRQVLDIRLSIRNVVAAIKSQTTLARLLIDKGNLEGAEQFLQDSELIAKHRNFQWYARENHRVRSTIALIRADYHSALSHAEYVSQSLLKDKNDRKMMRMETYLHALAHLGLGNLDKARSYAYDALACFLEGLKDGDSMHLNKIIHLLGPAVIVWVHDGYLEEAARIIAYIRNSHEYPRWMGSHPIFMDVQARLKVGLPVDVITAVEEQGKSMTAQQVVDFVREMFDPTAEHDDIALSADQTDPQIQVANQALIEPLSERELEVLTLISQGLSNREIADELVVGVSTVKKHINHIYGKLDVSSRTRAIVRAGELNLV